MFVCQMVAAAPSNGLLSHTSCGLCLALTHCNHIWKRAGFAGRQSAQHQAHRLYIHSNTENKPENKTDVEKIRSQRRLSMLCHQNLEALDNSDSVGLVSR